MAIPDQYHQTQFETPYESTKGFVTFLEQQGAFNLANPIIDIGCGWGANTLYLAKAYPKNQFIGMDLDPRSIDHAVKGAHQSGLSNITFSVQDVTELNQSLEGSGALGFQFLGWLPHYSPFLENLCAKNPKWVAFSSLFYEGPVDVLSTVMEYDDVTKAPTNTTYYNTYSLPRLQHLVSEWGYTQFTYQKFEIPIDLPKTTDKMGTFTVPLLNGLRHQLSGPILMNWYFVYFLRP